MPGSLVRWALLGLLWLDGFLVGVMALAFLPLHIGSVPFPISAVLAAIANCILLWCSATLSEGFARFGALIAFMIAFFVLAAGGPGGDIVVPQDLTVFLLLGLGLVAPVFVAFTGWLPDTKGAAKPVVAGSGE
ncbi:facilitated glucose transporter [Williamsia sp.]|uniref:facilitated glucose transporter n=1 Tax=Williamsia sp. TaxID=1872085 RepID=UPI002F95D437